MVRDRESKKRRALPAPKGPQFFFLFFNITVASGQEHLNTRPTQHTGDVATVEPTAVMENPHAGEGSYLFVSPP